MTTADLQLKRRIRRSTITWTIVALGFFFGFIALAVWRARP
jgi:hypothetical protein